MSSSEAAIAGADPIVDRLEDQIGWYDRKSTHNMRAYKRIKMSEIVAAAVIPFVAASHIPHSAVATGALGVMITVFEGMLQLNQFHENWITYRSTCESLKHEKYMFLARAAPCSNAADPRALLADRVESLVSQEHAKWASVQQDTKGKTA
ncbi:MAG: DUF4231 domain-containing protein [Candidatus Korobacteraceae bacterium]|jgi:uncharacterized protein DUF4231